MVFMPMYILWSTKYAGWRLRDGTYGTDRTNAQQFNETEAIAYCRPHAGPDHFGLLPVPLTILSEIRS